MLSPEVTLRIMSILLTDVHLLENRVRFLDSLKLSANDIVEIKKLNSNYEFFSVALNCWNSTSNATVNKLCEILISNKFQLVAEELEKQFPNGVPSASTQSIIDPETAFSFEVYPEVRNFTGRTKELKQLEELYLGNKEYVVTLTGMGGIGKSQLAKSFARRLQREQQIPIIWINGQIKVTLEAFVNRLSKIDSKSVAEGTVAKSMQNMLLDSVSNIPSKIKKRMLIIIDNVSEDNGGTDSLIKSQLPLNNCFFLITSRNLEVLNYLGEIIKLDIFPDQDAQHLVAVEIADEADDVKRLCDLLENFPLALQQAIAYIKKQMISSSKHYRISHYADNFQEASKKKQLLDYKLNLEHNYELTTLTTWEMTMEKIQKDKDVGDLAIKILNSIAYFEPYRIHMDLLQQFFQQKDDIEKAVQLIKTYSLVKVKDQMVTIHPLLQQVIQIHLSEKRLEVQHLREITLSILVILEAAEKEVRKFPSKFYINDDLSNDFDSNPLLNSIRWGIVHLFSVWNHNSKHPELMTKFKRIPIKIIDVVYPVWSKVSRIDDVTNFTEKNLSLFKAIFGINAIETLELEAEVAFASNQKLNENELDKIYKSQISIIGEDNLLQLRLLEKIAYYIVSQGSAYYKSVCDKYLREYLMVREKIMGPGHESTLPVPFQLIEQLMGNDPESVEEWDELLENAKILWGQHNHDTLTIMYEYGIFLYQNNKWVKAKEISEQWLGFKGTETTKEVTEAKCRLSDIQYYLGDRESALETLQQAMVGWEDREKKPKLFVEMRSECERGDGKVREGDLHHALRLYTRVTDYQRSNYPFYLYLNWWRMETCQKRASVLIQLRRCKEALIILQDEVHWGEFVVSDHKFVIEKNELLKEAEEGLRLAEETAASSPFNHA